MQQTIKDYILGLPWHRCSHCGSLVLNSASEALRVDLQGGLLPTIGYQHCPYCVAAFQSAKLLPGKGPSFIEIAYVRQPMDPVARIRGATRFAITLDDANFRGTVG